MPAPHYAISYTPPPDSPLARFGAGVLGYDCYHGRDVPHASIDGMQPAVLRLMTVEPRRHGFHAAFVAPFRLGDCGEDDLRAKLERFARSHRVVAMGPLAIATVGQSIVLRPAGQPAQLDEMAAVCLETFDSMRVPLLPAERRQHAEASLTTRQAELLDRWGDPNVLDLFSFHMTLAGPAAESELEPVAKALTAAFVPMAADHLEIDAVSLMREGDDMRFRVVERWRLTGR
jgi:hypothetical protein